MGRGACAVFVGLALSLAASAAMAQRALVVFGSAVRPDGSPGRQLVSRLRSALELAREDPTSHLIVTGGAVTSAHPEGRVMKRWLTRHGVAPARILVEPRARHTGENADLSVPLLRKLGAREATVVTSRYHARRARFHLRAALRQAGMGQVKVTTHQAPDGLRGLGRFKAWARESAKIVRDAGFRLRRRWGDGLRRLTLRHQAHGTSRTHTTAKVLSQF